MDLNDQHTRAYRFTDGPLDGQTTGQPRASLPQHCRPTGQILVWANAYAWPGQERYVPDGTDDDGTVVMRWRHATREEVDQAEAGRRCWLEEDFDTDGEEIGR